MSIEGLHPLSSQEIARWPLAPGDIYFHHAASGKTVRLKRAGDWLDSAWREKVRGSSQLLWRPIVKMPLILELGKLWMAWEKEADPEKAHEAWQVLRTRIAEGLAPGGEISLLDWAFTCHLMFKPDQQLQQEMFQRHVVLHRRSLYVSALATFFAMECGYTDPTFLRETYLAGWLLDLGLLHDHFSYFTALACQMEKKHPGAGIAFLKEQGATAQDQELFHEHPRLGMIRAERDWIDHFRYPALLKSILHHHELTDGSGFPEGMPLSMISDWEALLILADHLVDYREDVLEEYASGGLVQLMFDGATEFSPNLPVGRVWRKVAKWFRQKPAVLREEGSVA